MQQSKAAVQALFLFCWHALLSFRSHDAAMQQTETAVQAASAGLVPMLLACAT